MSHIFYRSMTKHYPVAVRGEGIYLWDEKGKRYLDGSSGALVANIGHGRREVAEAMAKQAQILPFVHGSQFVSPALAELAEILCQSLKNKGENSDQNSGDWRFFAVSGGSEATETAIKLTRQYHAEQGSSRYKIISRWTSYHGASLGALAASGLKGRRAIYEPLMNLNAFPKIEKPNTALTGQEDAQQLEKMILAEGPETIAAFLAEPIIGASDPALAPNDGYYEEIRRICNRYGILFIADEVMCGLGRTGQHFAFQHWNFSPDIIIVGKGLAAGYAPLAGILANPNVYETIKNGSGGFTHGFTYAGHPVSAAAGVAVLQILEKENLCENAQKMEQKLADGLKDLAKEFLFIVETRVKGLMAGLIFGQEDKKPFEKPGLGAEIGKIAFDKGLITYPGSGAVDGYRGDHLLLGPPLTINEQELGEMFDLLYDSLKNVKLASFKL